MWGSGFITILIYGSLGEAAQESKAILTENNFDLLAENGDELFTE
jgi:hypothetical protein